MNKLIKKLSPTTELIAILIIAHGFSNLIGFLGMHFHWYEKMQNFRDSLL